MPTTSFELPTKRTVQLIYGAKYPKDGTVYLQGIRSKHIDEDSHIAREYHGMSRMYAGRLAQEVAVNITNNVSLVMPPSSRRDAEPYRDALLLQLNAQDISARFTRKGNRKASEGHSIEKMMEEFKYRSGGDEIQIQNLLIIDESIASGTTAATLLAHLSNAGLREDCKVLVAAWGLLGR